MNKLSGINLRRADRGMSLEVVANAMTLEDALRIAASMSDEEKRSFIKSRIASIGYRGVLSLVKNFIKSIFSSKKTAAMYEGFNKTPDTSSPSKAKQLLEGVRDISGFIVLAIIMHGVFTGFFEPDNSETMMNLKNLAALTGAGLVSFLADIPSSKIK